MNKILPDRMIETSETNVSNQLNNKIEPTLRYALETDATSWNDYVVNHKHGTVFHLWNWNRIVTKVHGHTSHAIAAFVGSKIVGLLPLFHNKTILFGNSLVSSPFCPYAGPIADSPEVVKALVEMAEQIQAKLGASHFECRSLETVSEVQPTQEIYVTFRKEITSDHDANLNAIPRKQRAMVRKGIQNALTCKEGSVDEFFELYLDNIHRHGTPGSPKLFFQEIAREFGKDCEILIVYAPDGAPLSAVLSLYFREEVLPFYAGDDVKSRQFAANDFKYWSLMQRAADRGARLFDFGRSKKGTGPYSFKKNWGFEPTQLKYSFWGLGSRPIPENNPLNPKYRLLIATWRKLPKSVVRFIGPKVVRGLG